LLLLSAVGWTSCSSVRFPPPSVPTCTVLEGSMCTCSNGREQWEEDCFGYQAASPEDYEKLREFYDDKVKRLEICLTSPKKCQ
jgi:hypothetical protein